MTTTTTMEAWLTGWVDALSPARTESAAGSPVEAGTTTGTTTDSVPSPAHEAVSEPVHEIEPGPAPDDGSASMPAAVTARSVDLVGWVGHERSRLDADLLLAVRQVVQTCRAGVVADQGWDDTELTPGQGRTVQRDTKRRAITETFTALGLRTAEATTLVSLSMAAEEVQETVLAALDRGETRWTAQVQRFWEMTNSSARKLSEDQKLLVAMALFGTDPALAAVERFDPDGELTEDQPWPQAAFEAALTREVTACEGTDVVAEREKRRRAYRERRARIRVHDDGTATLIITGPVHKILAVHARHDDIARTLRSQGHPDTLAQLAVDSMLATLVHGTLDLPSDLSGPADALCDEDLDDLVAVVNGHPRVTLQVIVPADVLGLGHPVCATCATDLAANPRTAPGDIGAPPAGPTVSVGTAAPAGPEPPPTEPPPTDPERPSRGHDPDLRHGRGMVAEIIGSHPVFITPGHAREYFYTPGTTMYRLLTDPADGRCLERTITAYRPDADMRRQVQAADVYSRHPHSRLTGRSLEIDHVVPFGTEPGGTTTETNLADLNKRTHKVKTLREIAIAIDARRDLTFTTILGQLTHSRTHDYSQYLKTIHPEDLEDRQDLANRLLYAALAARPEHRYQPDRDTWLTIDHTDPVSGERRPGPPEHPDEVDRLLGIDDE